MENWSSCECYGQKDLGEQMYHQEVCRRQLAAVAGVFALGVRSVWLLVMSSRPGGGSCVLADGFLIWWMVCLRFPCGHPT